MKALLTIMAHGHWQGMDVHAPEVRALFTRESLLASDWYRRRLEVKRERDLALWRRKLDELLRFRHNPHNQEESRRLDLDARIAFVAEKLGRIEDPESWRDFIGTLGADPLAPATEAQPGARSEQARAAASAVG